MMGQSPGTGKANLRILVVLALCSANAQAREPASLLSASPPAKMQPAQHAGSAQKTVRILVKMSGFPDDQGRAIVALHFDQKSFPKAERAAIKRQVKIHQGQAVASFDNIPAGTYAVTVVHDRDLDGVLGFSWWPYPHTTEYAGVSRNQPVRLGPPKYQEAKFTVKNRDVTLKIHMQI